MHQTMGIDAAFRVRAVEQMQEAMNMTHLARQLGVSRWTLYRWQALYKKQGAAGLALQPMGRPVAHAEDAKRRLTRAEEAEEARAVIAEQQRKIGEQAMQIDFLTGAFKRVKGLRQSKRGSGGTASMEKSK
jgi:transposase